ncbi:MAG: hypothetical protein M3439_04765 [Chloroflexota bacterium]|nr:hypothetical protein [Chloroflexota bacterium]
MREQGSWSSETHLQKCVYVLTAGLGVPLNLNFILYKHGPFSFDLRATLGEMLGNLLIEAEPHPPYGPSLRPTESGTRLLARFPKTIQQYSPAISFVSEKLAKRDVAELERLGTALYVTRERPGTSIENRASQIVELKQHVKPELALKAVAEMDELLAAAPINVQ